MSIIKNIMSHTKEKDREYLAEALRFGGKERAEILKRSNEFMIGLEFEFLVDEGASHTANMSHQSPEFEKFIEDHIRHIHGLAEAVYQLKSVDTNKIRNLANDFIEVAAEGDPEVVASIIEYDYDEALRYVHPFSTIVLQSLNLRTQPYATVLKAHGLWSGERHSDEYRNLVYIKSKENSIITLSSDEAVLVVLRLGQILMAILEYLSTSVGMVRNLNEEGIKKDMYRLMKSIFLELNPHADPEKTRPSTKINTVEKTVPLPREWIDGIVPDLTVDEGAEVVTKPLSIQEIKKCLEIMGPYITKIGGTSQKTGLHVNVSMRNGFSKLNTAKVITMLDSEFFQNLSPSANKKFKYRPRLMVGNAFDSIDLDDLSALARAYVFGGARKFIAEYESIINFAAEKVTAINMEHFFYAKVESTRRIEFRFFGGYGYERRTDEIYDDILNIMYAMFIASDETFKREEYLSTIVRQLNRVVQRKNPRMSFSDLIQQEKAKRN